MMNMVGKMISCANVAAAIRARFSATKTSLEIAKCAENSLVGRLAIVGRDVIIDGLAIEFCSTGFLFRPASTYILDRTGEAVELVLEGRSLHGVVISTSVLGYKVEFIDELSHREFLTLKSDAYGLPECQPEARSPN
jgi:hypothetical protein